MNNAHVQPNGMYHYHGLPIGLIQTQKKPDDLIHVGFAGDGFKIYASMKNKFKSSYQLKKGPRSGGPVVCMMEPILRILSLNMALAT